LETKVKKTCEAFGANLYPCPATEQERAELLNQVKDRLADVENILGKTKSHRREVLTSVKHDLKSWKEQVTKEKAIFHTMNLFNYDKGRKCLIGEGILKITNLI